jgi:hypothetical protein
MMEAASTSETLANFYQATQRYYPEDSHLRIFKMVGNDVFLQSVGNHLQDFTALQHRRPQPAILK